MHYFFVESQHTHNNKLSILVLSNLIHTQPISIEKELVYNYSEDSASSKFYDNLFSDENKKTVKPELFREVKIESKKTQNSTGKIEEVVAFIEKRQKPNDVTIELGGGVHQGRSVNAYQRLNNYYPLDISGSSIRRYANKYNKPGIIADATKLPFKDNSVDFIFTQTFLEHPIHPENVVEEIARVLKPGGYILHLDAWFCRWWHHYGIVNLKKRENMSFKEKMIDTAAKITELKIIRIPPIVIKRIFKEIFISTKKPIELSYKKLTPNYELQLACDEDAASTIDPLDVIRFYESRGFQTTQPLSFKQRIFYPNKLVALKKK